MAPLDFLVVVTGLRGRKGKVTTGDKGFSGVPTDANLYNSYENIYEY